MVSFKLEIGLKLDIGLELEIGLELDIGLEIGVLQARRLRYFKLELESGLLQLTFCLAVVRCAVVLLGNAVVQPWFSRLAVGFHAQSSPV